MKVSACRQQLPNKWSKSSMSACLPGTRNELREEAEQMVVGPQFSCGR